MAKNTAFDYFFPTLPEDAENNDQASASTEELQPSPQIQNIEVEAFDSDVVPSSLHKITPILRVAAEVEPTNSRIAYLCRFYAFEQAHKLDPKSSGRGVRQYKIALLRRLERDCEPSLYVREKGSDAREMQSFYRHYTTTYLQSLQNFADKADSENITKTYQTARVLFEVLKAVNATESIEIDNQVPPPVPPPAPPSLPFLQCPIFQEQPAGNLETGSFDIEVVPYSLLGIAPILRVANEVEPSNSRVAYLCRFYAFEKAQKLDPTSSGRGVRRYKSALLQRLERDCDPSLSAREKRSDAREMQSFYRHYTTTYVQSLQNSADKADSAKRTKINQTARVLFEVLKAVNGTESTEIDDNEILKSNVGELSGCDIKEEMTSSDEGLLPPSPPSTGDHLFPAEEVLNPPPPVVAENEH